MHGCDPPSVLLVNAEVDSMGGVIEGRVGIGIKTSPLRAAIEKAQAELRVEYDVRGERRRELEFLEKGGNPLDFKFGNAASVSVQSTSLLDQAEQLVTSEAKGSFAVNASAYGDSVESSGGPGTTPMCEPNTADNFDGENEVFDGERNSTNFGRRNVFPPSEQSSQLDGNQNPRESEDSAIFRPYERRNRSRPNRDGARSSSTDFVQSNGSHGSNLPVQGGLQDRKWLISETNEMNQRTTASNPKSTTSNGHMIAAIETSDTPSNMVMESVQVPEAAAGVPESNLPEDRSGVIEPLILSDNQSDQSLEVDTQKTPINMESGECAQVDAKEQDNSADLKSSPCTVPKQTGKETGSTHLNGAIELRGNDGEGQSGIVGVVTNRLDTDFSVSGSGPNVDVNNDINLCSNHRSDDTNGIIVKKSLQSEGKPNLALDDVGNEKDQIKATENGAAINDNNDVSRNNSSYSPVVKIEAEVQRSSNLQEEEKCPTTEVDLDDHDGFRVCKTVDDVSKIGSNLKMETSCHDGFQSSGNPSIQELPKSSFLEGDSFAASNPQACSSNQLNLANKAREDSILEEARIIKAKRKRIAELYVGTSPPETRRKSHWDFVLEEMTWLANDFAQERLWKITAAAQICHRIANSPQKKLKKAAQALAGAVMRFWKSAERHMKRLDQKECSEDEFGELDKETGGGFKSQKSGRNHASIQGYALRFLKYDSSEVPSFQAEGPSTPDRINDLTEESLFYAVPSDARNNCITSIESHLLQIEKTGSGIQEEVDTSMCDAAKEFEPHENGFVEEEGESSTYYLPGIFETSKSTKHDKKRKPPMRSYSGRSFELRPDSPCGQGSFGPQENIVLGKRPANSLNVVLIPPKRVRSASRQKIISPFGAVAIGNLQAPTKTDASSGDTSSLQDDHSTLLGGSQVQKSMEVESAGDFQKQIPYDYMEASTKPKHKEGSTYEQGWLFDSNLQIDQRDNSKKRLENHHFDSRGTNGLHGHHVAKKAKKTKLLDNAHDMSPMTGSIPSPVASQMSNMSNTNKIMKIIVGSRDKGRKAKSMKITAGQPGSGSPWSLFEDQALVVLVHDMGPNWELVSDAINSTLQFKCIFRKPKECKERHRFLMDKGASDGADSAEDSGSSQSYHSTLPGIPKGSARQLFQRLQGPMEEDTLRSHFDKIITIGKRQHYKRSQHNNQDWKQVAPIHNSHTIALSQVCSNNLNGGFLTPLDLCEASASSQDVLPLGYQSSGSCGLAVPNQLPGSSMPPNSASRSSLQASSSMALGSNITSPSGPLNAPVRKDGRHNFPRTSLPLDEQQRIQHYNHILSARSLQQPNLSVSGSLSGTDRGVHMLPGRNGMGVMAAMNRNMSLSRPVQGMGSAPMLNLGSVHTSGMVGVPSPVGMRAGTGSGQGSMTTSGEALHVMQPGNNTEHQGQMMAPELQMQVSHGNSQGVPAFDGLSSAFTNQTIPPPVQTYSSHPQQQHQMPSQQSHMLNNSHRSLLQGTNHSTGSQPQAFAARLAKERQMQQRLLQQQQQQRQIAASSASMANVQSQPQLPRSSPKQNNMIQPETSPQSASMTPSPQMTPIPVQQQKHNLLHHGLSRNAQTGATGLTSQMGKQRQRQPLQQQQFQKSSRQHPQQQQPSLPPQQANLVKEMGQGDMIQNSLPVDHSNLNGLSVPPQNQTTEKGDQIMRMMPAQGLYTGAGLSTIQPSKQLVPPQSSNHSQMQQPIMASGHALSATHQTAGIIPSNSQHLQQQKNQKHVNQTQPTVQRILQPKHLLNSDMTKKPQADLGSTGQHAVNNVSQVGTVMPASHPCNGSANVVSAVSSAISSQWKQNEPLYESVGPAKVGPIGSPPLTKSAGSEPVASVSQDLVQGQISGALHGQNFGAQWQQKHQQSPQSATPPSSSREQQQSEQQMKHLQLAQGSLHVTSTNAKME